MSLDQETSGMLMKLGQCCQGGGFPAQLGYFKKRVAGKIMELRVAVFWAIFIMYCGHKNNNN